MKKNLRAFTLVELLVVIAIIGILIGMLLPAVQQVREAARRSKCQNNLKQLSLACLNFESSKMEFPAGDLLLEGNRNPSKNNTMRGTGWFIQILPFIEQQNIIDAINYNFSARWAQFQFDNDIFPNGGNGLADGIDLAFPGQHCPSNDLPVWTREYYGVQGAEDNFWPSNPTNRGAIHNDGILGINSGRSFSNITDGSSNTLIIGENYLPQWAGRIDGPAGTPGTVLDPGAAVVPGLASPPANVAGYAPWWWSGGGSTSNQSLADARLRFSNPARMNLTLNSPINDPRFFVGGASYNSQTGYNNQCFSSQHPGGANFVSADGHVTFVTDSTDVLVFRRFGSMDNGTIASFD